MTELFSDDDDADGGGNGAELEEQHLTPTEETEKLLHEWEEAGSVGTQERESAPDTLVGHTHLLAEQQVQVPRIRGSC